METLFWLFVLHTKLDSTTWIESYAKRHFFCVTPKVQHGKQKETKIKEDF